MVPNISQLRWETSWPVFQFTQKVNSVLLSTSMGGATHSHVCAKDTGKVPPFAMRLSDKVLNILFSLQTLLCYNMLMTSWHAAHSADLFWCNSWFHTLCPWFYLNKRLLEKSIAVCKCLALTNNSHPVSLGNARADAAAQSYTPTHYHWSFVCINSCLYSHLSYSTTVLCHTTGKNVVETLRCHTKGSSVAGTWK